MAQVVEEAKADDATAEFISYSLWVVPQADAERELADAISECASRLQTPSFLPHMTLLGGIVGIQEEDAIAKTKQVADAIQALNAKVRAVTSKVSASSYGLAAALVYGDLAREQKQELIAELEPRFDGVSVQLDRLQLWNTSDSVANWQLVREFQL
ncbi:hypothetical protein FI667_g6397, partial [Globisporangium splendens]